MWTLNGLQRHNQEDLCFQTMDVLKRLSEDWNELSLTSESASRCSSVVRILPVRSTLLYTTHPASLKSIRRSKETRSHVKVTKAEEIIQSTLTFSISPLLKLSSSSAVALKSYFPWASISWRVKRFRKRRKRCEVFLCMEKEKRGLKWQFSKKVKVKLSL